MANILILEDNTTLSFEWRELLNAQGHQVECQAKADISLNLIQKLSIDLVIVDMFFQQSDGLKLQGIDLLDQLNQLPPAQKPKLLAVSGQNIQLSILEVAQAVGVDLTLKKPIPPQQLVEAVAQLLTQTRETTLN